jgi:hypothetical protein
MFYHHPVGVIAATPNSSDLGSVRLRLQSPPEAGMTAHSRQAGKIRALMASPVI